MEQFKSSRLDQLAGHALQGLLANSDYSVAIEKTPEEIYAKAVAAAKGVEKELQKEEKKTEAQ